MKKTLMLLIIILGIYYSKSQEVFKFEVTKSSKKVKTASKNEEKITDAAGIVSVISKEEISNFGSVSSLWDILNRATSMYMIHGGVYTWNVGSVRGLQAGAYDTHVLILLNGRPFREGISGGFNSIIYNAFPVQTIERIEIIRGPGSVLYGSNAFAGVINIITKKADKSNYFYSDFQYGSFQTKALNFSGGIYVNKDLNINLSGRWYDDKGSDFNGVYDSNVEHNGQLISNSEYRKENWYKDNNSIFLGLNYKNITLSTGYGEIRPFSFVTPVKWETDIAKAGEEINLRRSFFDIGYANDLTNCISLTANVTFNGICQDSIPGHLKAKSNDLLGEITARVTPLNNLNVVLGTYFHINKYSGNSFVESGISNRYSFYTQAEYKLFNKMKIIAGSQFNMSKHYATNLSPRFGIVFNANDNFGTKMLYSYAFRAPFPIENFAIHPVYVGNPNLSPELVKTFEFQVFYEKNKLNTNITLFHSELEDLIQNSLIPPNDSSFNHYGRNISYFNTGNGTLYGIELEMKYKINNKISSFANATFLKSKSTTPEDIIIDSPSPVPSFMMKIGLMYQGKVITGGIYNSYFGKPKDNNYILQQFDMPKIPDLNPKATAYNLLTLNIDLHLSKLFKFSSKYDLIFGIYGDNLLNESIWFPEYVIRKINTLPLHSGRAIYGKFSLNF